MWRPASPISGGTNEALVLKRVVYTGRLVRLGVSHKHTIVGGMNLSVSYFRLQLWHEGLTLLKDQLLPAARRSLGPDDHLT
mmetsp:Transcript_2296/g.6551  ORF Transcript_2296/g.6551 Transcript_2296/m.6551 type:complete len:81 (+) Transcript_2296:123-365(+)